MYTYIHTYIHTYIMHNHRWNRNPRPQPQTFRNLVDYMFIHWLSGALVGVGGSDFIGYISLSLYVYIYIYIYVHAYTYTL